MTVHSLARSREEAQLRVQIASAQAALLKLGAGSPEVATSLVRLVQVIADEAARTPRFAKAIAGALTVEAPAGPVEAPVASPTPASEAPAKRTARRSKRSPEPFDPFAAYREGGAAGLREKLVPLELEQLKDIIAEHAMDYDKLAMRWWTPKKLQDRIVERVEALSTKGDVFR